jgi:hypothetical protein
MSEKDDEGTGPQASQQTPKPQPLAAKPAALMSADQAADKMRKLGVNLTTLVSEAAKTDLTDLAVEMEDSQPAKPPETKPAEKPPEEK